MQSTVYVKSLIITYVENNYGLLYLPLIFWLLILDIESCIFLFSFLTIHLYLGLINLLKDYVHNLYVWELSKLIINVSFIYLVKSFVFYIL
uniref:succinate:cytochrome c oxidoreductase subunit 4 n=1 Tax=Rhodella violacea TaxID=2801 RepID=UPI001FCD0B26|nr:succinate:cytochrome c oxidoreductase subunit 4 [Rhodella violacea]UNJ19089.1 succinate:cytochrome c oxidoreductase subunit 4 [Rhodella violacea]